MENFKVIDNFFQKLKKNEGKKMSENEIMSENWKSMTMLILSTYIAAIGFALTKFVESNFSIFPWEILVYATIFDVVPLMRTWTNGQSNVKIFAKNEEIHENERKYYSELQKRDDALTEIKIQKGITEWELKLLRDKNEKTEKIE
jgi:hypothetical protein